MKTNAPAPAVSAVRTAILALLILAAHATVAVAEEIDVPAAINYQGRLTDPSTGEPVEDGVYRIEFRIWNHPTATNAENLIWGRSFVVHIVTNGIFNVLLSDDGGELHNPDPQTNDLRQAFQGVHRYLGLKIVEGPSGPVDAPELRPRQRLVSAPYAMHARNCTYAYHAESSDTADSAEDADHLAGKQAQDFVEDSDFSAVGLHTSYGKVVAWKSGPSPEATELAAYSGRYYLGPSPSAPPAGEKLRIAGGDLHLTEDLVVDGRIRPSFGDGTHDGIHFPNDPAGGSGDRAWLIYHAREGEACTLSLGISNDGDDNLHLLASGTARLEGKVVEISGKVRSLGGWALVAHKSGMEEHAPRDCYYIVYANNAECHVEIGGHTFHIRQNRDDDWNASASCFPAAKGEHVRVTGVGRLNSSHDWDLRVYRRDLGAF